MDRADLAQALRRCRAAPRSIRGPGRGTEADQREAAVDRPRRQLHRPDAPRTRRRRTEGALAARHRARRRRLGNGLLRARCRIRPRQPLATRRARRRPLRAERTQDMDVRRDGRGLHLRAGAHVAGEAEAPRHQPDPRRHGSARRPGAADPPAVRRIAVQRNAVRGRVRQRRRHRRRRRQRLDGGQAPAAIRALDPRRHQHVWFPRRAVRRQYLAGAAQTLRRVFGRAYSGRGAAHEAIAPRDERSRATPHPAPRDRGDAGAGAGFRLLRGQTHGRFERASGPRVADRGDGRARPRRIGRNGRRVRRA